MGLYKVLTAKSCKAPPLRAVRQMSKKYIPAIFQPTVRPSWAGILSYISDEEKSKILEAIIVYPKETNIKSKFWEETIKPDLDNQYQSFKDVCSARGRGAKSYWESKGEDKLSLSSTKDIDKDKSFKGKDNNNIYLNNNINNNKTRKENIIKEKNKRYGECQNVILTEDQFNKLSAEHNNLNEAIEKLDTWLGTSGGKNKNKNHYPYFKSNSWVWENLKEDEKKYDPEIFIDEKTRIDENIPEFHDMTFDECERAHKWLNEKMYCQSLPRNKFIDIVRKFKGKNDEN